jgi:exopolysaccharide production protein ExoZ
MLKAVAARVLSPLTLPGTRNRVIPLEGLRGLAVLMVFFVHQAAFLEPWIGVDGGWGTAWRWLFNGGRLGVELFFTISGFLIYGMLMGGPVRPLTFAARRARRIYPAFLAVLALYLLLSIFSPADRRVPADHAAAALYLMENLLLLPGLFPIEPVITVSWTLSYELAFYVTAPFAAWLLGLRHWPRAGRAVFFLTLGAALLTTGGHARAALFVAGILVWEAVDAARTRDRPPGWRVEAAGILLFVLLIAVTVLFDGTNSTLIPSSGAVWGPALSALGCGVLAYAALAGRGPVAAVFAWAPLRWLGNLSYSFYLIHSVALRAVIEVLRRLMPAADGPAPWLLAALIPVTFLAAATAALVLFETVERPFSLTRRRSVKPPMPLEGEASLAK